MIVRTVYVCWHTRAPSPRVVEPQPPGKSWFSAMKGSATLNFRYIIIIIIIMLYSTAEQYKER